MSYNAVHTDDHEDVHNHSGSDAYSDVSSNATPPPVPTHDFNPLNVGFDNLGGFEASQDAHFDEPSSAASRLESLLRSAASTGTGYDMVEDDEYEDAQETAPQTSESGHREASGGADDTRSQQSPSPEPLVRRSSNNVSVHHPVPDLQSIQGAYVGNVHRLEESAERLSMTSNIADEIQKMKLDQKRRERQLSTPAIDTDMDHMPPLRKFSTASLSNSIIGVNSAARSGGYSPGGYISSPRESMRSGTGTWSQYSGRPRTASRPQTSRLSEVPEPDQHAQIDADGSGALSSMSSRILPPPPPPQHAVRHQTSNHSIRSSDVGNQTGHVHADRPSTSASNDTYRQATSLFTDFDGVHYLGRGSEPAVSRQASLHAANEGPLQSASPAAPKEAPFEEKNGVYYPAPVPMMLNLPQRLSKQPKAADREKRRTRALDAMQTDARKSALNLVRSSDNGENTKPERNSAIPAHLRASIFFEQPAQRTNIELKNNSAVATLDSILDASAYAPVSAFTEHPIVGEMGADIYRKQPKAMKSMANLDEQRKSRASKQFRNSSMMDLRRLRVSTAEMDAEELNGGRNRRSYIGSLAFEDDNDDEAISPSADELENSDDEEQKSGDEDEYGLPGHGDTRYAAPTTLMAELRIRQEQQKGRNRAAADAFPNGMHSTLLEMDAVVEQQKKSRRTKHIALAWEDPDAGNHSDEDDVPLGLLYPEKAQQPGQRIVGLLEQRNLEENEPLSRRRNRLRGIDVDPTVNKSSVTLPNLPNPVHDSDDDEPLAVRRKRLAAKDGTSPGLQSEFAAEVLSQFGGLNDTGATEAATATAAKTPDPEETLGQRRKRLQAEAKARMAANLTQQEDARKSGLSDILHANPAAPRGSSIAPSTVMNGGNNNNSNNASRRVSAMTLPTSYHQQQAQHAMTMNNIIPPTMYAATINPATNQRMTYYHSSNPGPIMPPQQRQPSSYGVPVHQPTAMIGGYGLQNPAFSVAGLGAPQTAYGGSQAMMYQQQRQFQLQQQALSLGSGQRDMINQWRQSVMH